LGEVEMIGAKTHPEFADMAVWQVARGMKGVVLKVDGGSRKRRAFLGHEDATEL